VQQRPFDDAADQLPPAVAVPIEHRLASRDVRRGLVESAELLQRRSTRQLDDGAVVSERLVRREDLLRLVVRAEGCLVPAHVPADDAQLLRRPRAQLRHDRRGYFPVMRPEMSTASRAIARAWAGI
jgi:hypothetical protein